jgi:hypothetical protein
MNVNELPAYDASDNPTGCCPRFNANGWDRQNLQFRDNRGGLTKLNRALSRISA